MLSSLAYGTLPEIPQVVDLKASSTLSVLSLRSDSRPLCLELLAAVRRELVRGSSGTKAPAREAIRRARLRHSIVRRGVEYSPPPSKKPGSSRSRPRTRVSERHHVVPEVPAPITARPASRRNLAIRHRAPCAAPPHHRPPVAGWGGAPSLGAQNASGSAVATLRRVRLRTAPDKTSPAPSTVLEASHSRRGRSRPNASRRRDARGHARGRQNPPFRSRCCRVQGVCAPARD